MKHRIYQLIVPMSIFGVFTALSDNFLIFPKEIINPIIFIPPILGLMLGPSAAIGVFLGDIIATPDWVNLKDNVNFFSILMNAFYAFLSGYLPYLLWHKWKTDNRDFQLTTKALKKFVAVLAITFLITSIFRAITSSPEEFESVTGLFGIGKRYNLATYLVVCFASDFFISLFLDLVFFFILISRNYNFYKTSNSGVKKITETEYKALKVTSFGYFIFPALFIYLDIEQIYGMDLIETWISFVVECIAVMDVYLILMIYLLLRYRRSIMMEIVFLVAITVFISAAVLGCGSSIAMSNIVNLGTDKSLHAMSVICRERLDRTFFCVRQAVNGMERQSLNNIESYERLKNDSKYRKEYLEAMAKRFDEIAVGTDGCLAYYMRLDPSIEGTKGGFSREREDKRWEGALSPFIERTPIDLARYSPDDVQNVGWYYIPRDSKCATWIEPYVDPEENDYVISYVAPLFVEGNFIGVIGMDIDFNFIIQELRRMSIYDYGYVYIMNRNNVVLYHKDRFQGSLFQPNPKFQEIEMYLANGMWLGIATPLNKVHDERNHMMMHLIAAILLVAMCITVFCIVLVSRAIRPLSRMTEAAKRIASGDLDVQISYESDNELGLLVKSIMEMANKLEYYVYRDRLTGLKNAAAYINKQSELDMQTDIAYAVILFDVNFLKKVNDNYGHEAGNQLLQHAAKVIETVFEHSTTYRIGGDEFVAILEDQDYNNRDALIKLFDEKIAEESFEASKEVPKEVPKEISKEISKEVLNEVPKDPSKEVSNEVPKDPSKEVSNEVPKAPSKEVSNEVPKDPSKEVSNEVPKDPSKEVSNEVPKDPSKEVLKETIYVSVARGIGIYKKGMQFSEVSAIADSQMYKHKIAIKAKYGEDVR